MSKQAEIKTPPHQESAPLIEAAIEVKDQHEYIDTRPLHDAETAQPDEKTDAQSEPIPPSIIEHIESERGMRSVTEVAVPQEVAVAHAKKLETAATASTATTQSTPKKEVAVAVENNLPLIEIADAAPEVDVLAESEPMWHVDPLPTEESTAGEAQPLPDIPTVGEVLPLAIDFESQPDVAAEQPMEIDAVPLSEETAFATFESRVMETLVLLEGEDASMALREVGMDDGWVETSQSSPRLELLVSITEGLRELSKPEQAELAPVLHEALAIAEYIHNIGSQDAPPTTLEQATIRLADVCRRIFDTLAIEYEEEDIERMVVMILQERRKKLATAVQSAALSDDVGTHERKHFRNLFRDSDKAEGHSPRLLGAFALTAMIFIVF